MTATFWPTPQDYNEAIQNPSIHLADLDLVHGVVDTNALGLPRSMSGAFASVYKVVSGGKAWAVRCFLSNRSEQQERYRHISDFVLMDDLECTIDFYYIENGIKIRNEWFPILKMPWVDGDTLDRWVMKNYKNTDQMKQLLADFHNMVASLTRAGISHCDLQVGNILVSPDGLRLVDYDALFVPALAGKKSLEVGHPSFQHPGRNSSHYNCNVDNFSAWLIHTGLMAIAIDPGLYEKYCNGDDNLLFRRADLADPDGSDLFKTLLNHQSENIRNATTILRRMLWCAPDKIPALGISGDELSHLPESEEQRYVPADDGDGTANGASETMPSDSSTTENSSTTAAASGDPSTELSAFDWIDTDAAITRASTKKSQKPDLLTTLTNKAITGWDNFHLWFSVNSWAAKTMGNAKKHFDRGDFDHALRLYHRVYKALEADKGADQEALSSCLYRLGCCYEASTTPGLATNYFLLALKNAKGRAAMKPALHLAVTRIKTNDETGALRIVFDSYNSDVDIVDEVLTELRQTEIDRIALFNVLMLLHKKLTDSKLMDLSVEVLLAAWWTVKTATAAGTIDSIDEYLDQILASLGLLKNTKKINEIYVDISQYCVGSRASVRGLIAFLCSAIQDYVDPEGEEPLSIKGAVITVANANLKSDENLSMLKSALLGVAQPDYVRDIFVRIAHEQFENSWLEAASRHLKIACDIAFEFNLSITEMMLTELELVDLSDLQCLDPFLKDSNVFKRLIRQLSDSDRRDLLVSMAKNMLVHRNIDALALLLTSLEYTSSPEIIEYLYEKIGLLPRKAVLDSRFKHNIDNVADSLKKVLPKNHGKATST